MRNHRKELFRKFRNAYADECLSADAAAAAAGAEGSTESTQAPSRVHVVLQAGHDAVARGEAGSPTEINVLAKVVTTSDATGGSDTSGSDNGGLPQRRPMQVCACVAMGVRERGVRSPW